MLGTYFFTVSSFSLSHTPSSLWIYGKTSNRAEPCLPVIANRPLRDPQRLQNVCARVGTEILCVLGPHYPAGNVCAELLWIWNICIYIANAIVFCESKEHQGWSLNNNQSKKVPLGKAKDKTAAWKFLAYVKQRKCKEMFWTKIKKIYISFKLQQWFQ